MSGLDVAQYVGKRFSDTAYIAAKQPAAAPAPAAPSPITVQVGAPAPDSPANSTSREG
jgi:hypothetical protein